jgi:gliding motility-associated-like protein
MEKYSLFFFKKRTKPHRIKSLKTCSLLLMIFIGSFMYSQGPGCPNVDAGADIELDCDQACTDLTATFLQTGETTSYEVTPIDYAPPFPSTGGTPVSVNTDDVWSDVIPMPFTFCFYGQAYNEMLIGSNAVVTFDTVNNTPGGFCDWSFSESIPDPNLFFATIFGPFMDINPAVAGSGVINFSVFGEAPCRTMVINFPNVPYFSCTDLSMTTQIVIYETTNVVEVYLESRSDQCPTWNSGNAVLGLQNQDGTQGIVAPGRQTGNWAATNEAWRFTPNGVSNVAFAWLDADGNELGTDPTINVCPVDASTVYTAQATYTNCNGDVIVETDQVTVNLVGSFTVDLGGNQNLCDTSSYDITASIINGDPNQATYLWSTGETTPTITVTNSGDYSVDVTIGACTITETVSIQFNESPAIDLGPDIETCFETPIVLDATPANVDPQTVSYEWSLDGDILPSETAATLPVTQGGNYTVTATVANCTSQASITISPRTDLEVTLENDFLTCPNEPLTLVATTPEEGVTYQWLLNDEIIANATSSTLETSLDPDTGSVQTYTVIITKGACTGSDDINISLYPIGNCTISQGLSPNGSPGFNDTLDLTFLNDRTGIAKLQIFNRLGVLVFEKSSYTNQWKGQDTNGNDLPTGAYFYVLDLLGDDPIYGNRATGWIYLNQDAN